MLRRAASASSSSRAECGVPPSERADALSVLAPAGLHAVAVGLDVSRGAMAELDASFEGEVAIPTGEGEVESGE